MAVASLVWPLGWCLRLTHDCMAQKTQQRVGKVVLTNSQGEKERGLGFWIVSGDFGLLREEIYGG